MTAVLLAENDADVCDFLAEVLKTELCAVVRCARTGLRAAEAIETGGFDLAIIDVGMPGVSGYELARRAANSNTPVLLCTGHPDALIKLKDHDFPHLAKPFALTELVYEAAQIITHNTENIRRVKASVVKLQVTMDGLQTDIANSRRLIAESKRLLAEDRLRTKSQA